MSRTSSTERTARARRLVSIADGASHAGLSGKTIRRYIAQGRLTGYRQGPRLLKVDLDEIDALATPIPTVAATA